MVQTILTVRVDQKLKQKAQRVAKKLGVPLSAMIKTSLREIVKRDPSVYCPSCGEEESFVPSKRLIRSLQQAERDRARGNYYSFDNTKDALSFLDKVIAGDVKV